MFGNVWIRLKSKVDHTFIQNDGHIVSLGYHPTVIYMVLLIVPIFRCKRVCAMFGIDRGRFDAGNTCDESEVVIIEIVQCVCHDEVQLRGVMPTKGDLHGEVVVVASILAVIDLVLYHAEFGNVWIRLKSKVDHAFTQNDGRPHREFGSSSDSYLHGAVNCSDIPL